MKMAGALPISIIFYFGCSFILIAQQFQVNIDALVYFFIPLYFMQAYTKAKNGMFLSTVCWVGIVFFAAIPYFVYDPYYNYFAGNWYRNPETISQAWFFIFAFAFITEILDSIFLGKSDRSPSFVYSLYASESELKRISIVTNILFCISVACYLYVSYLYGNLFSLFNLFDYSKLRSDVEISVPTYITFPTKLFLPVAVLSFYLIKYKRRPFYYSCLLLISFLAMMGTGTRQNVVSFLMAIYLINVGMISPLKSWKSYSHANGIKIFLFLILLAVSMRYLRAGDKVDEFILSQALYYDTFDSLCFVIDRVKLEGHEFLYTFYSLIVNWIPRSLWDDKPVNFGRLVALWIWGDGLDTGASYAPLIIGEALVNAGAFGVVLFGYIFIRVYSLSWLNIYSTKNAFKKISNIIFFTSSIIVFRGEFVGAVVDAFFKFAFPLMVYTLLFRTTKYLKLSSRIM